MKEFKLTVEGVEYTAKLTRSVLVKLESKGISMNLAKDKPLFYQSELLKECLAFGSNVEIDDNLLDKIVEKYDWSSIGDALLELTNEVFTGSETSPKAKVQIL